MASQQLTIKPLEAAAAAAKEDVAVRYGNRGRRHVIVRYAQGQRINPKVTNHVTLTYPMSRKGDRVDPSGYTDYITTAKVGKNGRPHIRDINAAIDAMPVNEKTDIRVQFTLEPNFEAADEVLYVDLLDISFFPNFATELYGAKIEVVESGPK